ncbi:protein phosphatase methylesterase 1-like [Bolinopsis microptera]|uniref:protein phosphatase methylesterase 1-like n=1 Tax=Bolinopsis microptera TaxID=2820187 RepID=UPI00307A40F6
MERLKELQRSSGGPPPPAASRPSYHPDAMDPGIAPAVLPTIEQGSGPGGLPFPNAGPPVCPVRTFNKPNKRPKRKRSFSELPWSDYFTSKKSVEAGGDKFCVYTTGSGPTVLCLHGGGHSSLSWALFTAELTQRASVTVVAIDQRGHGDTETDNDQDLSAETLSADVGRVWEALYPDPEDRPPVILMGHSMGGAVAVRVADQKLVPNIRGIVVIDVVEGSAMDALSAMQGVLKRRPQHFSSKRKAIEWILKSGQLRNNESARVSMGAQLKPYKKKEKENVAGEEGSLTAVQEEGDEENEETTENGYTWRVDLAASEKYWSGWYSGMSKLFLSVPTPKLLLLAGPDRLDTELTRAHMQGKFQVQMFNTAGHSVQEDLPEKVADVVSSFLVRQRFAQGSYNPQTIRPCC